MDKDWYRINNVEDIPSTSLVVFPRRIEENIKLMIKIAGGTEKLRPHIKTHKIAEIIKMQLDQGITKFKCATLSEAELLAKCNAKDILLDKRTSSRNIFNTTQIEKLLNNREKINYDFWGKKIWMLINVELWSREFIDKK